MGQFNITQSFPEVLRIGLLLVLFLFVAFSFVVLKQVQSMNRIINQQSFGKVIFVISVILLLLSIALFIIGFVIL